MALAVILLSATVRKDRKSVVKLYINKDFLPGHLLHHPWWPLQIGDRGPASILDPSGRHFRAGVGARPIA